MWNQPSCTSALSDGLNSYKVLPFPLLPGIIPITSSPSRPFESFGAFESYKLPQDAQLALQKVSGSSPSGFTVFLTAYVVLVARLTGDEDIAIGTDSSEDGRPFVLRVSIDSSDTFLGLYNKVEKVCIHI